MVCIKWNLGILFLKKIKVHFGLNKNVFDPKCFVSGIFKMLDSENSQRISCFLITFSPEVRALTKI